MQNPPAQVIKQCDIYWCDPDPQLVDTVGSEQKGDHVWLIASTEKLCRGNCVVGIPLSRHKDKAGGHLIAVPASEITVLDGSPSMDRVALTDQIRVLNKTRLRTKAGTLSRRAFFAVMTGMDRLFDRRFPSPTAH